MQWTDEQIGDIKTFELVEYSDHNTTAIYYV